MAGYNTSADITLEGSPLGRGITTQRQDNGARNKLRKGEDSNPGVGDSSS